MNRREAPYERRSEATLNDPTEGKEEAMAVDFDKYKVDGAIHWAQTNRMGLKYNAPLVSRYSSVFKRVP